MQQLPTLDYSALKVSQNPTATNTYYRPNIFVVLFFVLLSSLLVRAVTDSSVLKQLCQIVALASGVTLIPLVIRYGVKRRRQMIAKLTAFAQANKLTLSHDISNPTYDGLMFHLGHDRMLLESLLIPTGEHSMEIGNYQYVIGSGKNAQTNRIGFVRITLPRNLPNMVLDAKSNNFGSLFSNLPTVFDKNQVLSLEGNFNDYFTLYAPEQYKRDALYVFTPDVMAALIDNVDDYDVEIIGSNMYLYAKRYINIDDPVQLQQLIELTQKVGPELRDQTDRYADERVASAALNQIAIPGRRLKKGVNLAAVIFISAIIFMQFSFWLTDYVSPQDGLYLRILACVAILVTIVLLVTTAFRHRNKRS